MRKVYHGSIETVEHPNNQICILNQKIIDSCLKFEKAVKMKGKQNVE